MITEEIIESIRILAKLDLSVEEKEQAREDLSTMLAYMDKLRELDTEGIEPMSHSFPINNVFREDVVTNKDHRDEMLANAPAKKEGNFQIPHIFGK